MRKTLLSRYAIDKYESEKRNFSCVSVQLMILYSTKTVLLYCVCKSFSFFFFFFFFFYSICAEKKKQKKNKISFIYRRLSIFAMHVLLKTSFLFCDLSKHIWRGVIAKKVTLYQPRNNIFPPKKTNETPLN